MQNVALVKIVQKAWALAKKLANKINIYLQTKNIESFIFEVSLFNEIYFKKINNKHYVYDFYFHASYFFYSLHLAF
jgi:hypothetical protein